jgi:superfamily I DNA/RNA helicase
MRLPIVYRYFLYLLIDEMQDLTPLYLCLITGMLGSMMRRKRRNMPAPILITSGDQAQLIMRFNGAMQDAEQELMDRFMPIRIFLLEVKRCPKIVMNKANALMESQGDTFRSNIDDQVPFMIAHPKAIEGTFFIEGSYTKFPVDQKEATAVIVRNNKEANEIFDRNVGEGRDCMLGSGENVQTVRSMLMKELSWFKKKDMLHLDKIYSFLMGKSNVARGKNVRKQLLAILLELKFLDVEFNSDTGLFHLTNSIMRKFKERPLHMVTTVHRAKGLEWMRVYGVGIEHDIPSATAKRLGGLMLEQEWKLMFVFMTRTKRDLIMVTDVASLFDTTPEFNPEDMDVDSTPAEDLVTPPPRKGKSVADNLVRTERTATKRLKLDNATSLELTAFPSAALDTLKMCDLPTSNKDLKMVVNELKKEKLSEVETIAIDEAATTIRTYIYSIHGSSSKDITPSSSQE